MKQNVSMNDFVSGLTQAARDNPLAAALIGGGALWLMLGNRPLERAASGVATSAQAVAEKGMQAASQAADAVASAGSRVAEAASDMTRKASDVAANTSSSMTEKMQQAAGSASDTFSQQTEHLARTGEEKLRSAPGMVPPLREGFANAQSALTDLLDRQPLVLGALGLAIGAGVASAIKTTSLENELAGSYSDEVKDEIKTRAERVVETTQRAAGDLGNDFRAAASEALDKLRGASADARQSMPTP
jgi:hypothetical protein